MHDPRAGLLGGVVVRDVHLVHEQRLAGEVDVVGAGLGARGDQRLAELHVGPDRRDHDLGARDHCVEGGAVRAVGLDQLEVGQGGVEGNELVAHRLQLAAVAAGQRPANSGRRVLGEVLRGESSREAGGTEQDDVEIALCRLPGRRHVSTLPLAEPHARSGRPISGLR